MKHIYYILCFFLLASLVNAQIPIQNLGTPGNQVYTRGQGRVDSLEFMEGPVQIADSFVRTGLLYSDNFARSTLGINYSPVFATASITFPGNSYLEITGADGEQNNFIIRTGITTRNRYQQTFGFRAKDSIANSAIGFGISSTSNFTNSPIYAIIDLGTTSRRGRMFLNQNLTNTPGTAFDSAAGIIIHEADSMTITILRLDNEFIATLVNNTTGAASQIDHVYPYAGAVTNVGNVLFWSGGGTQDIYFLSRRTDERPNTILFIGNSITTGVSANSNYSRFQALLFPNRNLFEVAGGPGLTSGDALTAISEMASLRSKYALYDLGTNDAALGVSGNTFSANVTASIDTLINDGITPIVISTCPRNTVSVVPYNDTLQAIAARLGLTYIDTYDLLVAPGSTNWSPEFIFDGVHPNQAGYYVIYKAILKFAPQIFLKPQQVTKFNISNSASQNAYSLMIEPDGTVGIRPAFNNIGYWGSANTWTNNNYFNGTFNANMNNETIAAVQIFPSFNNNGYSGMIGLSLDLHGNSNLGSLVGIGGPYTSFPLTVYGQQHTTGTLFVGNTMSIDGQTNNRITAGAAYLELYNPSTGGYTFNSLQSAIQYGEFEFKFNTTNSLFGYPTGQWWIGNPVVVGNPNLLFPGTFTIQAIAGSHIAANILGQEKLDTVPTASPNDDVIAIGAADSVLKRKHELVAENDLAGQSGALATVTSYAVPGSGNFNTFNVSGYLTVTAVSVDVIQMQVTYTDETSTSRTQSFFVQGSSTGIGATGANGYSPLTIRVKQGTTITVSTVLTTGTGSITYDVGANITQLY